MSREFRRLLKVWRTMDSERWAVVAFLFAVGFVIWIVLVHGIP